jgi:hypothetical protein
MRPSAGESPPNTDFTPFMSILMAETLLTSMIASGRNTKTFSFAVSPQEIAPMDSSARMRHLA